MEGDSKQTPDRIGIIQTIQTPLGFFVFVVLVVEAILGSVAHTGHEPNDTYALFGMVGILVLLVMIVAMMAVFRPEALQGGRATVSALKATVVYPPTETERYKELFGGFSNCDFYAFNPPFEVEHAGDKLRADAYLIHESRYESGVKSRYLFFDKEHYANGERFFAGLSKNMSEQVLNEHVNRCFWEAAPENPGYTYFIGYKQGVPAIILYPSAVMEHGIPKAVVYIEGAEDLLVILKEYFVRQWNMAQLSRSVA